MPHRHALLAMMQVSRAAYRRMHHLEPVIARHAPSAWDYVQWVLKSPWPEAEATLARQPDIALKYAKAYKPGPWPEIEPLVARWSHTALAYAQHTGQRFPAGEAVLVKDRIRAGVYAADILKGRWLEAEALLAQKKEQALDYVEKVLRAPWPDAEKVLLSDPHTAACYALASGKRAHLLEERIAFLPLVRQKYHQAFIHTRWPAWEESLYASDVHTRVALCHLEEYFPILWAWASLEPPENISNEALTLLYVTKPKDAAVRAYMERCGVQVSALETLVELTTHDRPNRPPPAYLTPVAQVAGFVARAPSASYDLAHVLEIISMARKSYPRMLPVDNPSFL